MSIEELSSKGSPASQQARISRALTEFNVLALRYAGYTTDEIRAYAASPKLPSATSFIRNTLNEMLTSGQNRKARR
jgi:hypothetical protein